MTNMPDKFFYCIGAGRGGTTWLHKNLRQHPEVFLSPEEGKETHYFNQIHSGDWQFYIFRSNQRVRFFKERVLPKILKGEISLETIRWWEHFALNMAVNDAWYTSLFVEHHDSVCGDITPAYAMLSDQGVAHMARLAPKAPILFLLRDPVERAWSHYKLELRINRHLDPVEHINKKSATEIISEIHEGAYIYQSKYNEHIKRYLKNFAKEQIHILFYEEVMSDQEKALKNIYNIIGLNDLNFIPTNLSKTINASADASIPTGVEAVLKSAFKPVVNYVKYRKGSVPSEWTERYA